MPPLVLLGVFAGIALLMGRGSSSASGGGELRGDTVQEQSPAGARPELARITLSPHYTAADMVVSGSRPDLAARTVPTDAQLGNLAALAAAVLEPLGRELLGTWPRVTSGLRSPELNAAVGGEAHSEHLTGQAVDVMPPPGMTSASVARKLIAARIPFDQLIAYSKARGGHLHVSYRASGGNRGQLLAAPSSGGYVATTPDKLDSLLA